MQPTKVSTTACTVANDSDIDDGDSDGDGDDDGGMVTDDV